MKDIRDRIKVNIDKSFHEKYIDLKIAAGKSYLDCPFSDFREFFLLSAVIGVRNNLYIQLEKNKEGIFDSNVFSEHFDLPLLYTIAFAKEKNVDLLSDDDYVLRTVEGYANGGFNTILSEIEDGSSNNLMNLATYLAELIDS